MPRRAFPLLLALALAPAPSSGGPGAARAPALTDAEKRFLDATNEARKKHKAPPLKVNPVLCKVARAHSENMARQQKLAHELDGKNQFHRIKGAGYRYRYAGENIARGSPNVTVAEVIQGLLDSPKHREVMLAERFVEVGVGVAHDAKGDTLYYTQVFGTLKPPQAEEDP